MSDKSNPGTFVRRRRSDPSLSSLLTVKLAPESDKSDSGISVRRRWSDPSLPVSLLPPPEGSFETAPCPALKLPPEVMLRIFAFFSIEELCRLGAVCRYWFSVSRDPFLWRCVRIRRLCPLSSSVGLLSYAVQPEIVHITNYSPVNDLLALSPLFTAHTLDSLRCLDLGFCELSMETAYLLFVARLPNLRHLNIEGCRVIDVNVIEAICDSVDNLQRVNLSHCVNMCDVGLSRLCTAMHGLTHVNVDGVEWISDEGVAKMVAELGPQLEAVWLDGANLSNRTVARLGGCPKLHLLSVRFCEALVDLTPLTWMKSLQSLTLRKASQVTRQHISDFLSPDHSLLTGLTYLDLSECSVLTDEVLIGLGNLCGAKLRHLVLDWCWEVTDAGLSLITGLCFNLEWLSLAGLHNLTGNPLRQHPQVLPQLKVLNLTNCNRIHDDVIQEVVNQNPTLIAFGYYGDRFETDGAIRPELGSDHDLWRIADREYTRVCQC